MKKKFMMVTLLLGTLFLGACVDDNETASVSAVREATAKQLKSVAAMNRAEAEAQKTLAAAEVALLQAKAAAEKANAEYNNALVEQQKKATELLELQKEAQTIENQQKQAELEKQLALLEKTKLQAQADLADIEAQMKKAELDAQAALMRAQKDLLAAQQDLLDCEERLAQAKSDAEREAILAERDELNRLASNYADAANNLLVAKAEYNAAVSMLVGLENGLVSYQQTKEQAIIDNNNKIAQYKVRIEAYKQYTNYTEDVQALKNKRAELVAKQNLLYDDYNTAFSDYMAIYSDNAASREFTDSLRYKDKFSTFARYGLTNGGYQDGDNWKPLDWTIRQIMNDNGGTALEASDFVTYSKVYSYEASELGWSVSGSFGDSLAIDQFPTMPDFRGQAELAVEDREAQLKGWIKDEQDRQKKLEKWYNGAATEGDYGTVMDDGNGNMVPSTKACKNLVDSTAYLKAKYEAETDATAKENYRNQYQASLSRETSVKQSIENAIYGAESYQEFLDNLLEQWDMLTNYATYQQELQKAMDKRNAMVVEEYADEVAAWYVYQEKDAAYQAVGIEIAAVDAVLNYNNGVQGAENIESSIKYYEDEIARLEADNEDYSLIESQEEAIAMQKDIVAAKEAVVKALEVIAAQTKAELDAALAKGEETEE
ncbi:MAG: hypothetical protein ACI4C3_05580 [Bacteroides sp.]